MLLVCSGKIKNQLFLYTFCLPIWVESTFFRAIFVVDHDLMSVTVSTCTDCISVCVTDIRCECMCDGLCIEPGVGWGLVLVRFWLHQMKLSWETGHFCQSGLCLFGSYYVRFIFDCFISNDI